MTDRYAESDIWPNPPASQQPARPATLARSRRMDLSGHCFGRLLVIHEAEPIRRGDRPGLIRRWQCQCDCGADVVVRQSDLRSGRTRSCGCRQRDLTRATAAARRQDTASYSCAHRRVQTGRGKAAHLKCVDCGQQAAEWSYDGGDPEELTAVIRTFEARYSLKSEYYSPRCRSCHRRLDARRGETRAA